MTAALRRHLDLIRRDLDAQLAVMKLEVRGLGPLMLAVTVLALAAAVLAIAFGGYHAGFVTLNGWGATLPKAWLERLTYCGDSLFALLLLLLVVRRHPELVWLALLATLLATLISRGLKPLVDALRPAAVLASDSFHLIGPVLRVQSFPSGHATTAFISAGVFCCIARRHWQRALLLGVALLVGWSRVAVGAHWPVDVLGGAATGCFSVWLALRLMQPWRRQLRPERLLGLVALLAFSAVIALFLQPPYPDARPLLVALALGALALTVYDFIVLPLQRRRLSPEP